MRVVVIPAIALAIIALLAIPQGAALFDVGFMGGPVNIGTSYIIGPGFTFAEPFSQGGYILNEARTSNLARTFTGSLAISFEQPNQLAPGGFPALAPAIAQTTSQSVVATSSYFFNDFLASA
jgi:hypothetical protein